MTGDLLLTVPELVLAVYLVPVDTPPDDPMALLQQRLPEGSGLVQAMVDRGHLTVSVEPGGPAALPMELLAVFGADPERLAALAAAPHLLAVQVPGLAGWPPVHEVAGRSAARALAGPEGSVVDVVVPRLLLGADVEEPGDAPALTDLVVVPQSAGDRGHWLTTKGLGRFGLPELQAIDVSPQLAPAWTSLLSGLAHVLVHRFHAAIEVASAALVDDDGFPAFASLDAVVAVDVTDVARAYGAGDQEAQEAMDAAEPGEGRTRVQLEFEPSDPDHDEFLTVRAPDDFGRSSGEFHAEAVAELFGRGEAEVRHVAATDDMDAAIATARSCLPVARHRFLAGEFGHHTLLMVKYRLDAPDGSAEFPWFFVTSWSDQHRLAGSSASDAEADPSVRVGRPVTVALAAVADWGVWVDGDGLIEGGWTNALLEGEPPPPIPTIEGTARPERRRRFGRRRR